MIHFVCLLDFIFRFVITVKVLLSVESDFTFVLFVLCCFHLVNDTVCVCVCVCDFIFTFVILVV